MAVTQSGAHIAPVSFYRNEPAPLEPYHISPWQGERHHLPEGASEAILRGDFLCLPFGKTEPYLGMHAHGRTAGERWSFARHESWAGRHTLDIVMENGLNSAQVTRRFFLRDGENVIYDVTSIAGLDGDFTLGHHAVLRTPKREKSLLVSTSRQLFGMTFPGRFAMPEQGEYQSLAIAAEFESLHGVPSIFRDTPLVDCSAYPDRRGFSDMLQIAVKAEPGQPAWTAAVNTEEGFLWFSLRDPALLPSTIIWIENCGRHNPPWSGRNCSLGLEDVCSFFDRGSEAAGKPNAFSMRGIKTIQSFVPKTPFLLPYIQGLVRIPQGFGQVKDVHCDTGSVSFTDVNGMIVTTKVQTGFVFGEHMSAGEKIGHSAPRERSIAAE